MNAKLSFLGVGPKIGRIALPWLLATILFSLKFKHIFSFTHGESRTLFIIGTAILTVGLVLYLMTVPALLKGLKQTKLVTTGTFSLCCNPLYASIILLIIPGTSLMMNSWLVLTTSVVGYIAFKSVIASEYREMESFFGEEYVSYRKNTPEFFPVPFRRRAAAGR